jgi:aminopeptidase YwaD
MPDKIEIDELVDASFKITSELIKDYGPRITGDEATKKVAFQLKEKYNNYCDKTEIQKFDVYPKSFLGWIKILCILYLFSTIMHFLKFPLISAIAISIGLIIMILQFFYYKALIDRFYKKKEGVNVWGVIEPSNDKEPDRQIIISGHHDSSYIFNLLVNQPKLYALRIFGGIGFVFLMFLLSWIIWILSIFGININIFSSIWSWISLISLILVSQLWFYAGNEGTVGAGDNLMASVITLQIARNLRNQVSKNKGLKNTRVILASWDAEEAGLRGARYFCKEKVEELRKIPTFVLNMDCLYNLEDLFFLTSDINGTVKLSTKLAEKCVKTAHELGYTSEIRPIEFLTGGTDAGEFGKLGIEATSLIAMPWGNSNRSAVYHTPDDDVDSIDRNLVRAVIEIILKLIEKIDK